MTRILTNMSERSFRVYRFLQHALAPGLQNSQYAYKEALQAHCRPGIAWLDLGCGHQLLQDWMPRRLQDEAEMLRKPQLFVGIDANIPGLRKNGSSRHLVAGDIEILPFRDETFDLATANMVIEHVQRPEKLLSEVRRILRPGGEFLFHTPNRWGYPIMIARLLPQRVKAWFIRLLEGRTAGDVFATFYRLNSVPLIKALALKNGMQVAESSLIESSAETAVLGPLVIFELLLIRALRTNVLSKFRTNLIIVMTKHRAPTNG